MSASPPPRFVVLISLALLGACGGGSEGESTLPPAEDAANRLPALVAGGADGVAPTPQSLAAFVESRARALASAPYREPGTRSPESVAALDYDAYRSIRFRPERAFWRDGGRFQIQLFHPGSLFDTPVEIHLVEDSVRAVAFDPALFRYDGEAAGAGAALAAEGAAAGLGFSGFRVHYPINAPERMDEFAVFQGASYFRLVGRDQVYGLSARGLAVDVATDHPEEFPAFRAFWLVRPAADADTLVVHALLDSPSVTGAFRFALVPGERTTAVVDARLFARTDVGKLGVAPLSSMFLFDADLAGAFDDFRGAVHDSDGLLMRTSRDEWIWRPLGNLRGLRVTSLRDVDPLGFGLAQRERDFGSYLDLEAQYHRRPSAWVRAADGERWGEGGVELLEIPARTEYADNVAAYWVPSEPFRAGEERRYRYTVTTFGDRLPAQTLGQVIRTRSGGEARPAGDDVADAGVRSTDARRFAIDFAGGPLDDLPADAAVTVHAETLAGTLEEVRAEPLPTRGWRASLLVRAGGDRPPDMRVWLELDGRPLTETWSYAWYPEAGR